MESSIILTICCYCRRGRGRVGEMGCRTLGMWPGGNKSKFLRNDLTGNDSASASPRRGSEPPRGEKSFLITEQCQSAVGEDDEIIKHFPCVFFIRPVLFFFQVLGKQNRSPASSGTTAAASRGNSS